MMKIIVVRMASQRAAHAHAIFRLPAKSGSAARADAEAGNQSRTP
jgi:hypothetical protein